MSNPIDTTKLTIKLITSWGVMMWLSELHHFLILNNLSLLTTLCHIIKVVSLVVSLEVSIGLLIFKMTKQTITNTHTFLQKQTVLYDSAFRLQNHLLLFRHGFQTSDKNLLKKQTAPKSSLCSLMGGTQLWFQMFFY